VPVRPVHVRHTPARAPRIGIVLPVYNSREFIDAALDSIRSQDLTDWMCVVVDDQSPDDTAEHVRAVAAVDDRIRLVTQAVNGGQCVARNSGLDHLDPEIPYVSFLDGDDLYAPGAFCRLVEVLERRPDAVGAFGMAEYVDTAGNAMLPGRHRERQLDRRCWRGRSSSRSHPDTTPPSPTWPPTTRRGRRPWPCCAQVPCGREAGSTPPSCPARTRTCSCAWRGRARSR
jgi:glycosyltransferase involved in cell wall biosynthesis